MSGPCFADVVGTLRNHLPSCHENGKMVLTRCIQAFICCDGKWKRLKLPSKFVFIDLRSEKAFLINKCTGEVSLVDWTKCLIDYRGGRFFRLNKHHWKVVGTFVVSNECDRS